ncbi:MAG: hypothetical protein ACR2N5_04835 [Solirubrobacterales bacterium]
MSAALVNTIITLIVLAFLVWMMYRPRVQASVTYKAMVVPLANIMDVGFLVLSPIIVVLVGYGAPLVMLGICLLAIVTGFAISYNIRNYEPLIGKPDRLHTWNSVATWALIAASIVNIAYYSQLLSSLVLLPLGDLYTEDRAAILGGIVLGILTIVGFTWGLSALNRLGNKTTAFNLSALAAILVAFAVFNVQELLGSDFEWPEFDTDVDGETFRKILGLFAMVQGFEAARYMGAYFGGEKRISTMRMAQGIATVVFVLLITFSLLLFVEVKPPPDGTAIFVISKEVSAFLPFLILAAALGSQLSAIVNAAESRSEMVVAQLGKGFGQKWTFPLILVPAIVVGLLTDITSAVAIASRVFAAYFLVQALIAGQLAWRTRSWSWLALFTFIGFAMAIVAIFGIPA